MLTGTKYNTQCKCRPNGLEAYIGVNLKGLGKGKKFCNTSVLIENAPKSMSRFCIDRFKMLFFLQIINSTRTISKDTLNLLKLHNVCCRHNQNCKR